jgi:Tfp pilus assembly protein PilF
MRKPTPTLIRLHIDQGYLGKAREFLDAMPARGETRAEVADLEQRWAVAARLARREASVVLLRKLLVRVRRERARIQAARGAAWPR